MARRQLPLSFPWEKFYVAAILETDDQRLPERIRDADQAISTRIVALTQSEDHVAEILEIENALKGLRVLRRERLHVD